MTEDVKDQQPTELDLLKARAKQMDIKHHHNIGVPKLKALLDDALNGSKEAAPTIPTKGNIKGDLNGVDPRSINYPGRHKDAHTAKVTLIGTGNAKGQTPDQEDSKLIRIRVNCMNPNKTDYEGDIFTVSRKGGKTYKKYVSYNNDEGWHVPNIIYKHLLERKCQIFVAKKDSRGNITREGRLINEFAIEVMDKLTPIELHELAQRQAMANGTEA